MGQKSIGLYKEEQMEAWKNASKLALSDMKEDGFENPSNGDILAYICKAYTGNL